MSAITCRQLRKSFADFEVLRGIDLQVERGELFGFLGPNGAGKTTTIRTMLDMIRPTSGQIRVFGLDSRADAVQIHRRVGYLPGEFALYEYVVVNDTVDAAVERLAAIVLAERSKVKRMRAVAEEIIATFPATCSNDSGRGGAEGA